MRYAGIAWTSYGCETLFNDGSAIASYPHDTHHYYVISHRCGYGNDILTYCREHDFFHTFCAEWFYDKPSSVLWELAHGREDSFSVFEELTVQACQRWVRVNERPIIGGVDWSAFKLLAERQLKLAYTRK